MSSKLFSDKKSFGVFIILIVLAAALHACNGNGLGVTPTGQPDFGNLCNDSLRAGYNPGHALCADSNITKKQM